MKLLAQQTLAVCPNFSTYKHLSTSNKHILSDVPLKLPGEVSRNTLTLSLSLILTQSLSLSLSLTLTLTVSLTRSRAGSSASTGPSRSTCRRTTRAPPSRSRRCKRASGKANGPGVA